MFLATLYSSVTEMLIGNLFPIHSGYLMLKSDMHIITYSTWGLFRLTFTHEEHCGFNFPWHLNHCLPFSTDSSHHDFHHSKNIGNYSQFTHFWDWLFGTEIVYERLKQKKQLFYQK